MLKNEKILNYYYDKKIYKTNKKMMFIYKYIHTFSNQSIFQLTDV